jgi:hypothetical protein
VPLDRSEAPAEFRDKFRPALQLLLEAFDYAAQTSGDRWEFAVEIGKLWELGLSPNDVRWLVRGNVVDHAREVTVPGDCGREFRPTGDLTFTDASCVVLTASGAAAARRFWEGRAEAPGGPSSTAPRTSDESESAAAPRAPHWDAAKRVLSFAGRVVKQFKWHAINQESVLAAFEEEGWPARIDDPLSPQPEQDAKRRLSDTIKCLNRKQKHRILHFRGDGTGEGVVWEVVEGDAPDGTPS